MLKSKSPTNNGGINVLSLFDGMSCGRIALDRAGIEVNNYYASEIDKYATKVSEDNYPDIIRLGDITKWEEWDIDWGSIDLLIGGSPCQGFSFAGKQLAFDDPRSKLFFVYVDILNHIRSVNPEVKFLLENVRMKKEFLDVITEQLGVEPVFINSALVSAQNRQRYYWANWEFGQPDNNGIVLADILEDGEVDRDKSYCIDACYYKGGNPKQYFNKSRRQLVFIIQKPRGFNKGGAKALDGKSPSLSSSSWQHNNHLTDGVSYRKLTPLECERLQTVLQYIKQVEIVLCSDQAKSFVDAVEKNPKLLKLVSSAESEELREYARRANQSTSASLASTKHTALQNADMQIQTQTEKCTKGSQDALNSSAGIAENITTYKQAGSEENSAIQYAFMNITEGKITHYGKEESPQKGQSYTEHLNGKIVLNLCGSEIMQDVNDALSALEIMQTNHHSTSITSYRLSTKNLEQTLIICYWFAKNAIVGFTQGTTKTRTLYLSLADGYTAHVSNTQRYKMLGNGWTVDVIAHILRGIDA